MTEIYTTLIEQNNHNLIPFSVTLTDGFKLDDTIHFEIETLNHLDYTKLIEQQQIEKIDSETYLPVEKPNDDINNRLYVEIIANDNSGLKKYNVRTQEHMYGMKGIDKTYNIPKFSWNNDFFAKTFSDLENYDFNTSAVWISDKNKTINRIQYNQDKTIKTFSHDVEKNTIKMIFDNNKLYVTTKAKLIKYTADDYFMSEESSEEDEWSVQTEIMEETTIPNNNEIISLVNDFAWTVNSYEGTINKRDKTTLELIDKYEGFDAPNKIMWSSSHNSYIISGTNVLWKLTKEGVKESIYSINNYEIIDFDVAPEGYICILFQNENQSIIRILKNDLYNILLDYSLDEYRANKCIYCDEGLFYVLAELISEESYEFTSYLFNVGNNDFVGIQDVATIAETTETTTPIPPVNIIEVDEPSSGTWTMQGSTLNILWRSSESINDLVKIDLYKDNQNILNVANEIPNNGIYEWVIPSDLEDGIDYKIKITRLTATFSESNVGESDNFTISSLVTTTTTTTRNFGRSIGISFNPSRRHVVNVLNNGYMGFFDLNKKSFYGLFDIDLDNAYSMTSRDDSIFSFNDITHVRLFVGSKNNINDKWDSGIVETNCSSMYYGGGNNLIPGEKYYVNIQVKDKEHGWSSIQTKSFVMPK